MSGFARDQDRADVNRDGVVNEHDLRYFEEIYSEAREASVEFAGLDVNGDGSLYDPADMDELHKLVRSAGSLLSPQGFAEGGKGTRWYIGGEGADDANADGSISRPFKTFRAWHDYAWHTLGLRATCGEIMLMPNDRGELTCGPLGGEYGAVWVGGKSWSEPLVVKTDPRFSADANAPFGGRAQCEFHPGRRSFRVTGECPGFVRLEGLRFGTEECAGGAGGGEGTQIESYHCGGPIWVEDCEIRGGRVGVSIVSDVANRGRVASIIRRNIIREQRAQLSDQLASGMDAGGHSHGMGFSCQDEIVIEENVFYRNGRRESNSDGSPGNGTIYNHACYGTSNNANMLVRSNLVVEPSASAAQFRGGPGGRMIGNVVLRAPTGLGIGHAQAEWPAQANRRNVIAGNTVLGSTYISVINGVVNAPGWGLVHHRMIGTQILANLLWGNFEPLAKFGLVRDSGSISESAIIRGNVVGGYGRSVLHLSPLAAGEFMVDNELDAFPGCVINTDEFCEVAPKLQRRRWQWDAARHSVVGYRDQALDLLRRISGGGVA